MDTISIVTFLTGSSLVASVIVSLFKDACAKVSARYGSLITQVVLLVVCLIIASLVTASALLPQNVLAVAGAIFAGAITLYEVFYKAIYKKAISGNIN